jgi:hypothetical protein
MQHLESLTNRIRSLGPTTTSVVYSSPLVSRPLSVNGSGFRADGVAGESGGPEQLEVTREPARRIRQS